jgi:hypothetical protein
VGEEEAAPSILGVESSSQDLELARGVCAMAFLRAVVVVEFDVDVGQTPVFCYPPDALSETDTKKIAYLALPDSNTGLMNDLVYTFRFRW